MALLWSFLGNDPERVACLLNPIKAQLRDDSGRAAQPRAFRLGFFQGDDVLMHRSPLEGGEPFDLMRASAHLRTDALLAATTESADDHGALGRFRNWVAGFTGQFELDAESIRTLRAALSTPLERSLTQASPAQLLFHHCLQTLGLPRLDDPTVTPQQLVGIIGETLGALGRLIGSDHVAQARFALALTNGRMLVVARHGVAVSYQQLRTPDCQVCAQRDPTVSAQKRAAEHEHLRAVIAVAGDSAPPFATVLADKTALVVNANLETMERPLFR